MPPNNQTSPSDMTSGQSQSALRDIFSGVMNQVPIDDVDLSQATVRGFKGDVQLLDHQIIGRAWMRTREDFTHKRQGGLLADDMGLGKTIQVLARIVEGVPTESVTSEGWCPYTLVVCPLSLVGQWVSEIEKLTNLRVLRYQGSSRVPAFDTHDVVVTTYDVIKSEHAAFLLADQEVVTGVSGSTNRRRSLASQRRRQPGTRSIFEVRWWRIVLDEAHVIKNHKSKAALACYELAGRYRWCLTGTPIQNNVTEVYSLVKFLEIKPFSDWDTFNEQIVKPVMTGKGAARVIQRLQVVLSPIMLCRLKNQITIPKALLPGRFVEVVSCSFDAFERKFYLALESKLRSVLKSIEQEQAKNYFSILVLLLRLRQACNHPALVKSDDDVSTPHGPNGDDSDDDSNLAASFDRIGVTNKCSLCTQEISSNDIVNPKELASRCHDCMSFVDTARVQLLSGVSDSNIVPSSAKIRMLLKILQDIDERSGSVEKTIIFSQFSHMLDLIEPFLRERGVGWARYDGSMTPKDRETSLERIRTSATTRLLLMSFKAGCTGLNLTACNNVILVDMWWNPALEDQAFDRAHRFGQRRDVHIYKLKVDETVEDRILLLQEKKRSMAAAALSGDKIKGRRLGMDELLALFRGAGGRHDG